MWTERKQDEKVYACFPIVKMENGRVTTEICCQLGDPYAIRHQKDKEAGKTPTEPPQELAQNE